jgi:hypothetical protein
MSQCACGETPSAMRHTAFAMSPTTSICGKYTGSTSADEKFMWMTVLFPGRITNGGFSMTSWPTLMMQSAASIARWTKSPSESAAQPSQSGWASSTTPLPIWVLRNGMPVRSTNARSISDVSLRFAPAPIISSGRRDAVIASTAWATARSSATGLRGWPGGRAGASACSLAMSSGSSRCVAPGRSSSALRNASRTAPGTWSAEISVLVCLVSGRIMPTTSTIWKCPCLLALIGFCPVIITIGIAPSWA